MRAEVGKSSRQEGDRAGSGDPVDTRDAGAGRESRGEGK